MEPSKIEDELEDGEHLSKEQEGAAKLNTYWNIKVRRSIVMADKIDRLGCEPGRDVIKPSQYSHGKMGGGNDIMILLVKNGVFQEAFCHLSTLW